jgi:hypothetical protein
MEDDPWRVDRVDYLVVAVGLLLAVFVTFGLAVWVQ